MMASVFDDVKVLANVNPARIKDVHGAVFDYRHQSRASSSGGINS
ncbi:hypothetical protein [Pseudomonas syringae]|nr:hypothetical protein [Pseudomonas syringae]